MRSSTCNRTVGLSASKFSSRERRLGGIERVEHGGHLRRNLNRKHVRILLARTDADRRVRQPSCG